MDEEAASKRGRRVMKKREQKREGERKRERVNDSGQASKVCYGMKMEDRRRMRACFLFNLLKERLDGLRFIDAPV